MNVEPERHIQAKFRTGWILSGIVIAFLIVDCVGTLVGIAPLKRATLEIGYPLELLWLVGALQLVCLLLDVIPATCVLGAIVLTGFLGGAIASHLRVAAALNPEMIVSLVLGVLAWAGLWFRSAALHLDPASPLAQRARPPSAGRQSGTGFSCAKKRSRRYRGLACDVGS